MISGEEWRVVPFAQGYLVNNKGQIKSTARVIVRKDGKPYPVKEKILKQRNYNYATVDLKIGHPVLVHRIIASAFLGLDYSDKKQIVNHIDGNRLNNNLDNLEICNHQYNVQDGFNRGRIIHNKGVSKLSKEDKELIIEKYNSGMSQRNIAKMFNISQSKVSGVVNDHNG